MFEEKTFYFQFGKRHFEASTVAVSQSMPGVRKLGKNLAAFLFPASGKMADVQNKHRFPLFSNFVFRVSVN